MKTETAQAPKGAQANNNNGAAAADSQPGNMSTRQLAASLSKTAPSETASSGPEAAEGKTAEDAKAAGAKGTTRGRSRTAKAERVEPQPENVEPEVPETPENPENPETTEEPESPEPENPENPESPEEPEAPETPEQPKPELPAELVQAIEEAKAAGEEGKGKLLKRLHRLVDERDTHRNQRLALEEQNRALGAKVEELQKGGQAQGQAPDRQVHPEVARVNQELANVDYWRNWIAENPEGGELPDGKGGKLQLDAAAVKKLDRRLEDQRTELVARKVQTERQVESAWNESYAKHHAEAAERYPWIKNQNSPEHQEMQAILQAFPGIKSAPDYEKVLAWMFRGRAAEEADRKAKANGNGAALKKAPPAREPTKVPTNPPNGTTTGKKTDVKAAEAETAFKKSGSTRDLASMFAARGRAVSK